MASASPFRHFLGLLGLVLLVPGAITVLGAAWLLVSSLNLVGDMRSAPGRVVALVPGTSGTMGRTAHGSQSMVEFTTHEGQTLRVTDPVLRRLQVQHSVGESVTVRYPSRDPSQAEIGSSRWVKGLIGAGLLLRFRPRPAMPAPGA